MSNFYEIKGSTLEALAEQYKNKDLIQTDIDTDEKPACTLEDMTSGFKDVYYKSHKINEIPYCMFYNMPNLKGIECKNNNDLKLIRSHALNNTSIEYAYFPTVEELQDCAFYECRNLKYTDFSNTKKIYNIVFYECCSLEEITFNSLTYLQQKCFYLCPKLTSLIIKNTSSVCELYSKSVFQATPIYPYDEFNVGTSSSPVYKTFNLKFDTEGYVYVTDADYEQYKTLANSKYFNEKNGLRRMSEFTSDKTELIGYVYVPSNLLESYKTATNWSLIKDRIRSYN